MKMPAALVLAVLVWSSAKYLPTYFVEMRKVDLLEERMQLDAAKQLSALKDLRTQMQSQTKAAASETKVDKRFYQARAPCAVGARGTGCGMSKPLTNHEKRDLKAKAQRLEPAIRVGHGGVSEAFLKGLDEALTLHGLVKVKFTDHKEEKKTLAPEIAEKTASELIMRVGNVAVYYRAKPDVSAQA